MANYRITLGTGFAWCVSYVIKTDILTTDYSALVDVLIDYLEVKEDYHILDMDNEYEWDENYENIYEKADHNWIMYPDEFIQGGNHGKVLHHYGTFEITEIDDTEINDEDEIVETGCQDCKHFYECDNIGHYENCNMYDFGMR